LLKAGTGLKGTNGKEHLEKGNRYEIIGNEVEKSGEPIKDV